MKILSNKKLYASEDNIYECANEAESILEDIINNLSEEAAYSEDVDYESAINSLYTVNEELVDSTKLWVKIQHDMSSIPRDVVDYIQDEISSVIIDIEANFPDLYIEEKFTRDSWGITISRY